MKKGLILLILSIFVLTACSNHLDTCEGIEDPCELFECEVDLCWCYEAGPDGAIVYEKDVTIENEDDAIALVEEYLGDVYDQKSASKISDNFYNVFFVDSLGYEEFYTIHKDGKVMLTVCGV